MRLVSIVGDSISTFEGYNPQGYAVFYNKEMQRLNGLTSVEDTWWTIVTQALHASVCVNNSYSGSKVSGITFPAGECIERISNLRVKGNNPDYGLVYLGFNDFGNGVQVRRKRWFKFNKNPNSFEDAYDNMLKTIKSYYPGARVVCGTLLRTKIKDDINWEFPEKFAGFELKEYNDVIRRITKKNSCLLADIALSNENCETLDGSHPTVKGHATLAGAWIDCLSELDLL